MDAGPAGNPIDEDGEPPTAVEGARGQLVRSERAAKLARQLFLLAEQAQRVEAAEAALHPQPVGLPEAEAEQLRDDLRRKLFPRDRDLSQP